MIGEIDTHGDVHVAAVLDEHGGLLATHSFAADAAGYARLLAWFESHGPIFLTTFMPWRGPAAAIGLVIWIVIWTSPQAQIERLRMGGLIVGEVRTPRETTPLAEYLVFRTPFEPASSVTWTLIAAIAFTAFAALVYRRQQF
mgnify:FL=1